jgi:rhamnosyltransferase
MNNCCAICVTYNPNLSVFQAAISAAVSQVARVYVIDNGSKDPFDHILANYENVEGHFLYENKGIAAGFNLGIQLARKAGYSYVLLLDQDSIPPKGMVGRYLDVMLEQSVNDCCVAAIGPRYRSPETGQISSFVRFNWFRNSYYGGSGEHLVISADFLISSGSFYELAVFDKVGLFDEKLFIDHVDTEWFQRAASQGYRCFGVWDVTMTHSLGESAVCLWFLRWRSQPIHKHFRLYYIYRNSFLMYKMTHISFKWISGDVIRLCRMALIYLIFSRERREALQWIIRGSRDGILGVSGKCK